MVLINRNPGCIALPIDPFHRIGVSCYAPRGLDGDGFEGCERNSRDEGGGLAFQEGAMLGFHSQGKSLVYYLFARGG
jgi:hypothetical protein